MRDEIKFLGQVSFRPQPEKCCFKSWIWMLLESWTRLLHLLKRDLCTVLLLLKFDSNVFSWECITDCQWVIYCKSSQYSLVIMPIKTEWWYAWMCVCVHACVCVCQCVFVYVCVSLCLCMCVEWVGVYACAQACVHLHDAIHLQVCLGVCMCVRVCVCQCVCMSVCLCVRVSVCRGSGGVCMCPGIRALTYVNCLLVESNLRNSSACVCVCMCICVRVRVCLCVCAHNASICLWLRQCLCLSQANTCGVCICVWMRMHVCVFVGVRACVSVCLPMRAYCVL